jgi:diguanylate cyclase (GGDEF)-like protein
MLGAVIAAGVWTSQGQGVPAMVIYEVTGYLAAALILVGVWRRRPALWWPWVAIAAAVALNATGDLVYDLTEVLGHQPGYTSMLADCAYLASYPFAIGAAVGLLGGRGRRRDTAVLLDGALYAVAAWLVIWVVAVQPQLDTSHVSIVDWLPTVLYPPLDLVVVVAIWRVGRGELRRCGAWQLLFLAYGLMVATDAAYAVLAMPDHGTVSDVLSVSFLCAYAAAAAAALHPNMARVISIPEPVLRLRSPRASICGVALALAVPAFLLLGWPDAVLAQRQVVAAAALVLIVGGFARVLIAVDRQRDAEAALGWHAMHDPLTGLPNRVALLERIDSALHRARRLGTTCSVLFLDLDEFKIINDTLGHSVGDQLLVAVAERLHEAVRAGDCVARLGGDEFLVLCEDLESTADADAAAIRLLSALREPFRVAGTELHINASVGMVTDAQLALNDPETLLRDADVAMYSAKAEGRGRVEVFAPAMHDRLRERLATETALRKALTDGELRLMFQPIVRLSDRSVEAWEALLRWERPGVGLVLPDAFVPVAESSGLIIDVGAWVLRHAARRLRALREHDPVIQMSANVSARELGHPGMARRAIEILATEQVEPDALLLEITESALLEPTPTVAGNLDELRRAGFRFAIDDFGTGYSSLASLKRLKVVTIKIDRVFTEGLGRDSDDTTLVATIIEMAHSLGIAVTAEGVERAEQLEILVMLGCDAAQGFYIGCSTFDPAELDTGTGRSAASLRAESSPGANGAPSR